MSFFDWIVAGAGIYVGWALLPIALGAVVIAIGISVYFFAAVADQVIKGVKFLRSLFQ